MNIFEHLLNLQGMALNDNDIEQAATIEREIDLLADSPETYNLPYELQPKQDYGDFRDYDYDTREYEIDPAGGFGLNSHI
jgi:hypothetical protein